MTWASRQSFVNGYQHEKPDHWMNGGTPWLIERSDEVIRVPVYGSIKATTNDHGVFLPKWIDYKEIAHFAVGDDGDVVLHADLAPCEAGQSAECARF